MESSWTRKRRIGLIFTTPYVLNSFINFAQLIKCSLIEMLSMIFSRYHCFYNTILMVSSCRYFLIVSYAATGHRKSDLAGAPYHPRRDDRCRWRCRWGLIKFLFFHNASWPNIQIVFFTCWMVLTRHGRPSRPGSTRPWWPANKSCSTLYASFVLIRYVQYVCFVSYFELRKCWMGYLDISQLRMMISWFFLQLTS